MKNILNNLVNKKRKLKQKVKKIKYHEDGKLKKTVERVTEFEETPQCEHCEDGKV